MIQYELRKGDTRPPQRHPELRLTFSPRHGYPFRWLPRHGDPFCVAEWFSQRMIRSLAWLPIYTAIVVTVVLLIQLFGVPFVGGNL